MLTYLRRSARASLLLALPLALLGACDTPTNTGDDVRAHLEGAKVSLTEAMQLAAAEVPQGATLEASLTERSGDARFEIARHDADAAHNVLIPLSTGDIAGVESAAVSDASAAERMQAMSDAAITPEEAIAIAEAEVGGQAYEFEFEDGEFEVEVLSEAGVYEVAISPDGEVLEVEADDGEDDEDAEDGEDGEDAEDAEDADAEGEDEDGEDADAAP